MEVVGLPKVRTSCVHRYRGKKEKKNYPIALGTDTLHDVPRAARISNHSF